MFALEKIHTEQGEISWKCQEFKVFKRKSGLWKIGIFQVMALVQLFKFWEELQVVRPFGKKCHSTQLFDVISRGLVTSNDKWIIAYYSLCARGWSQLLQKGVYLSCKMCNRDKLWLSDSLFCPAMTWLLRPSIIANVREFVVWPSHIKTCPLSYWEKYLWLLRGDDVFDGWSENDFINQVQASSRTKSWVASWDNLDDVGNKWPN